VVYDTCWDEVGFDWIFRTVQACGDWAVFLFIARDAGEDVFVHYSAIEDQGGFRTLREEQRVEFAVERGPKGLQATHVRAL
jgi:CspA family cold shock protein